MKRTNRWTTVRFIKRWRRVAFGLPIICSLKGELRKLIERQRRGEYYEAGNPHSLARAVLHLAEAPEKREQAGHNARELHAHQFDAKLITQCLITHLEALTQTAC